MWRRRFLIGVAVALAAAQLVPVARTNPPATGEIAAPLQVDGILQRACYDCHSHETRWPWYARVAPVSWLVAWDVAEGREHLNFSIWETYPARKKRKQLEEIVEVIEEDEMPLWYYRPAHRDAALSDGDRARLIDWSRAERARLQEPQAPPARRGGAAPPSSAPARETP